MKTIYGVFTPYNQNSEGKPRVYGNGRIIGSFHSSLSAAEAVLNHEETVEGSIICKMTYTSTAMPFVGVVEDGKLKTLGYFQDISDALEVAQIPDLSKRGAGAAVYALPDPKTSDAVFHSVEGFKAFYSPYKWVSPEPLNVVDYGSAVANMFKIF